MRHILSREHRQVLEQFANSRVLLAFDFDGTLAPIVEDRKAARMRSTTLALLEQLCDLYPCAVLSGRSRRDLLPRLHGARPTHVTGNHGLESGSGFSTFIREVSEAKGCLVEWLRATPGIDIEDKGLSLAIHYRKSRQKRLAMAAIGEAIASLPVPFRAVPGKFVINALPARAPSRGDVLLELREKTGQDTALYVGDDVSDEEVFHLDQPGRLLCVRIGASATSAAPYFLKNQLEVDRLLSALVAFRTRKNS